MSLLPEVEPNTYSYNSIPLIESTNSVQLADAVAAWLDKLISVPICRECQVQAPCSKWEGKYPYET